MFFKSTTVKYFSRKDRECEITFQAEYCSTQLVFRELWELVLKGVTNAVQSTVVM